MIALERVSKSYRTDGRPKTVLDDVSAVFESGLSYGLLGVNGAGKSTTLRLIAGIELPNAGRVRRSRRVSWPLGFAGGFHPQMTGQENIHFVARVYGEDPRRIARFVQEFAELGDYLRNPVKTYSSGMMARLAFGLSMAIEFDVYLIDEITAVGDARFQARCAAAFDARRSTADLIVVSHSMQTIAKYCDRGALIVEGQLLTYPDVGLAIAAYLRLNR
ncbi:ABC transporter ATP-binding protein [Paralimibaculum aggregatum]|uniref:ABC transporter ATP-binding protein n=1 Tax=Paralimibaculum aggregatum TaxID=3036245 RepID=A0ABQ6LJH2_9RHOB|nr:ABC transporter ATP-binding protein [Limibaculum sp. NKW23]GMG80819.1 ABC transporter ATP-binding protein [Limibaculum sp. NKW23]